MKIDLIISAGGSGERYGRNKLLEPLGDSTVIACAVEPFLHFEQISKVIIACSAAALPDIKRSLVRFSDKKISYCLGGESRFQTVKNAVRHIEKDAELTLIHDGARPYVSCDLIRSVIEKSKDFDAAVPLVKLTDSIVELDGIKPCDRERFRAVQTPVAAKTEILKEAYQNAQSAFYDDISVIKTLDYAKIAYIDGDIGNKKITYPSDLKSECLSGVGYDIHRLAEGSGIKLFGIHVPCEFSFVAHSDGDVPIHAIMDAILTALGKKDIGHYFPVDDPRYDGADSMELLDEVLSIADDCGYSVSNVSVSVIAQRPMISHLIDDMRLSLASKLHIPIQRVGISATTNEGVGDLGASKAIAAIATVTMCR